MLTSDFEVTGAALTAALAAVAPAPSAFAATTTLHVSSSGGGTSCTAAEPCSLSTAQTEVRSLTGAMSYDIVVELAGGVYRLSAEGMAVVSRGSGPRWPAARTSPAWNSSARCSPRERSTSSRRARSGESPTSCESPPWRTPTTCRSAPSGTPPIGLLHAATATPNHLASELQDLEPPHGVRVDLHVENGEFVLGDTPGTGVRVDEDMIRASRQPSTPADGNPNVDRNQPDAAC